MEIPSILVKQTEAARKNKAIVAIASLAAIGLVPSDQLDQAPANQPISINHRIKELRQCCQFVHNWSEPEDFLEMWVRYGELIYLIEYLTCCGPTLLASDTKTDWSDHWPEIRSRAMTDDLEQDPISIDHALAILLDANELIQSTVPDRTTAITLPREPDHPDHQERALFRPPKSLAKEIQTLDQLSNRMTYLSTYHDPRLVEIGELLILHTISEISGSILAIAVAP